MHWERFFLVCMETILFLTISTLQQDKFLVQYRLDMVAMTPALIVYPEQKSQPA